MAKRAGAIAKQRQHRWTGASSRVAALAGRPCYDLIFRGRDFPNGGTSDWTPLWAALVARSDANIAAPKKQRFRPPLLYQNGANGKPRSEFACHDITAGQNASYPDPGVG